jgi:hypothetical protein
MTADAPNKGKRSDLRQWRRIISYLPLLAVLVFLVSNLIISGPWTRLWIASWIEKRIGLPTRVAGFAWSPWHGATLHSLEIQQPEALRSELKDPLLSIQNIRFTPNWRALIRRKFEIERIEFDTPRILLPVELLSYLIQQATPPTPPIVAANPTPTPAAPTTTPPPVPTAPAAQAPVPAQIPPPALPEIPPQPTLWFDVKNASFTVVSVQSGKILAEARDVTGSLPLFGDPAKSSLKFGTVSTLGSPLISDLTIPLDWHFPMLSIPPFESEIHGYKCLFSAKLAYFSKFPLQLEAQVPPQVLRSFSLPFALTASAESVAASARFRGLLLAPGTWDGELRTELTQTTVQAPDQTAVFDRGSSLTLLRGGALSCVNAQLISDNLSLLGNATICADGRLAGAARVVSSPETVNGIASRVFPQVPGPRPLTELSTPQRSAFDLEIAGTLNQAIIRLGKNGTIFELKP